MSYRKLDENGDMTFGSGLLNFYNQSVEEVAQSILTRLKLYRGEWFLDTTEGLPLAAVVGKNAIDTIQPAIRQRIINTPTNPVINELAFFFNPENRTSSLKADVSTIYGSIQLATEL